MYKTIMNPHKLKSNGYRFSTNVFMPHHLGYISLYKTICGSIIIDFENNI